MDNNHSSNIDSVLAEEIPIELIQSGVHISDQEVLDHSYLILEVRLFYLGNRRNYVK